MALFDTSQIGRAFDASLFAENLLPLAAYLETDGLRELAQLKSVRTTRYEKVLPLASAIAEALISQTPQRSRWGRQMPEGRWITIQAGKAARSGSSQWTASKISNLDILKHLTGRTFACGTSDIAIENYRWKGTQLMPNYVSCLRFDIDQDAAWQNNDVNGVIAPLKIQRDLVRSIGLPFHAFATGGRGVQAVIALPKAAPHMIATLIESVLIEAIALHMPKGCEGLVDKTALRALMRLPGGLHAKTGRLAAWINLDEGEFYPIEVQGELMKAGLAWQEVPGLLTKNDLQVAIGPIGRYMLKQGITYTDYLDLAKSLAILERFSHLAFAASLLNLLDKGTSSASKTLSASPKRDLKPKIDRPRPSEPNADTQPQSTSASSEFRQWAQRVWDRSFISGAFYSWIAMDGERGILAAKVLFGDDGARDKLIQRAHAVPCRSSVQLRERLRVIEEYCGSFRPNAGRVKVQSNKTVTFLPLSIDLRVKELAEDAIKRQLPASGKVRWNIELGTRLLSIILQEIALSDIGFFTGSIDSLVGHFNSTWADQPTNRQRAAEMLRRFCDGFAHQKPLLYRLKGNHAASEPNMYRCGPALSGTWIDLETTKRAHHWLETVRFAPASLTDEDD